MTRFAVGRLTRSIRVTSDVYGFLLPAVDASVTRGLEEMFAEPPDLLAASSRPRT